MALGTVVKLGLHTFEFEDRPVSRYRVIVDPPFFRAPDPGRSHQLNRVSKLAVDAVPVQFDFHSDGSAYKRYETAGAAGRAKRVGFAIDWASIYLGADFSQFWPETAVVDGLTFTRFAKMTDCPDPTTARDAGTAVEYRCDASPLHLYVVVQPPYKNQLAPRDVIEFRR